MSVTSRAGTFTYTLTNSTLTIEENDGISYLSAVCTTSTTGTLIGTQKFKSIAPTAITLEENIPFAIAATPLRVLSGITITAPAGCSIDIIMTN